MKLPPPVRYLAGLVSLLFLPFSLSAQVGPSLGVTDANTVTKNDLVSMPHVTEEIADQIVAARPFESITDLNTLLLDAGLSQEEAMELYTKTFVNVNLNSGTPEEFRLVPGAGTRMPREFAEYRPWVSWAQFDREIGKYVDQTVVDQLKQYLFIPVKLNSATDADFLTIPNSGQRMLREFKEYRPWRTKEQFDREISKYVGDKETSRLWRYMTID